MAKLPGPPTSLTSMLRSIPALGPEYHPRDLDNRHQLQRVERAVSEAIEEPIDEPLIPPIIAETRLQTIARLTRDLTYGEMVEYCNGIGKAKGESTTIPVEKLPETMHAWAMGVKP